MALVRVSLELGRECAARDLETWRFNRIAEVSDHVAGHDRLADALAATSALRRAARTHPAGVMTRRSGDSRRPPSSAAHDSATAIHYWPGG